MKKMIVIAMAAMLSCSVFAGCGGGSESNSAAETKAEANVDENAADETSAAASNANEEASFEYVGTWVVVKFVTADGNEYGLTDYAAAANMTEEDATVTYTFSEDGKVACTQGTLGVEGTYTVSGNEIQTTFTGSNPKFVYDEETGELCLNDEVTNLVTYYAKMN